MSKQHVTDQLSRFINQELSPDERQSVGEHLFHCDQCRREHDEIRFGARLATTLEQQDADPYLWSRINRELDGTSSRARPWYLGLVNVAPVAVALIVVAVFSIAVYRGLFAPDTTPPVVQNVPETGPQIPTSTVVPDAVQPTVSVSPELAVNPDNQQQQPEPQIAEPHVPQPAIASTGSWDVATLAGTPQIEGSTDKLAVGASLVTDSKSRAKVEVADIGTVEVAPNSHVRLVNTTKKQHRLSLERGELHAKIYAPPRLFIVDTPSAAAVDLGCEYTLSVDEKGNSILNVLTGYVALERGDRESIVFAGATCKTDKAIGVGTPFSKDATPQFKAALDWFDFGGGGTKAIDALLAGCSHYDMITLWHLLPRVAPTDRGRIFDKLASYVKPPSTVTREGIQRANKKMLALWREAVEDAWFS
jgi:hypothetical protein